MIRTKVFQNISILFILLTSTTQKANAVHFDSESFEIHPKIVFSDTQTILTVKGKFINHNDYDVQVSYNCMFIPIKNVKLIFPVLESLGVNGGAGAGFLTVGSDFELGGNVSFQNNINDFKITESVLRGPIKKIEVKSNSIKEISDSCYNITQVKSSDINPGFLTN